MNFSTNSLCFVAILLLLNYCGTHPKSAFNSAAIPPVPDYSQDQFWAALPWKDDPADMCPDGFTDQQNSSGVDVFFLHPTTYTGKKGENNWNGPVRDAGLNERTLEGTIQFQASIFNGAGRVYAPYYRQAHLHAYFTDDERSAKRAFDLAYSDVRSAFMYYLSHHNQGRPIIIASHSQGATHAIKLLKEFFDGQELQNQLVTAYLVGMPVSEEFFTQIKVCQTPTETGCFCTWRTFKKGHTPEQDFEGGEVVVTNPLSWTTTEEYSAKTENQGAVLVPFQKVRTASTDAQIEGSILWASKPRFPGSFLMLRSNYHVADLNIFYANVRANAIERVSAFLADTEESE